MIYFWQGNIEIEDELMMEFWKLASVSVTSHAIDFIGRNLKQSKEFVPQEVKVRLQHLLEFRLSNILSKEDNERKKELQGFGWWFGSKVFESGWSLKTLMAVLSQTNGMIKADNEVVKGLADMSSFHIAEVIDCLKQMVEAHKEPWGISLWIEGMRTILRVGLNSPELTITSSATDLIHYLGSKGYLEFRDLVKNERI